MLAPMIEKSMDIRVKIICDRLKTVIDLTERGNFSGFPLDYLKEIYEDADKLINPSEEELVDKLRKGTKCQN